MADGKSAHSSVLCPEPRRHRRSQPPPQESRLPGKLGPVRRESELYQRSYHLLIIERQRADTCVKPAILNVYAAPLPQCSLTFALRLFVDRSAQVPIAGGELG